MTKDLLNHSKTQTTSAKVLLTLTSSGQNAKNVRTHLALKLNGIPNLLKTTLGGAGLEDLMEINLLFHFTR
jgi:hypothetical protein